MSQSEPIEFVKQEGEGKVSPYVALGVCDISLASIRCMASASSVSSSFSRTTYSLKGHPPIPSKVLVEEFSNILTSFTRKDGLGQPLTILILNAKLSASSEAWVAQALVNFLVDNNCQELFIPVALNIKGTERAYMHLLGGKQVYCMGTGYPALPPNCTLQDNLVNHLVTLLTIEKLPATLLVVPGKKASHFDKEEEVLHTLCEHVSKLLDMNIKAEDYLNVPISFSELEENISKSDFEKKGSIYC